MLVGWGLENFSLARRPFYVRASYFLEHGSVIDEVSFFLFFRWHSMRITLLKLFRVIFLRKSGHTGGKELVNAHLLAVGLRMLKVLIYCCASCLMDRSFLIAIVLLTGSENIETKKRTEAMELDLSSAKQKYAHFT